MSSENPKLAVTQYLSAMFALNPVYASADILARRRTALKLQVARDRVDKTPQVQIDPQNLAAKREQLSNLIKTLQAEFWTMPQETLVAQLDTVNLRQFPDFRPLLTRLKIAAACRKEIQHLLARKDTDTHMVSAFRAAIILPPDKAAGSRERFLRSIETKEKMKLVTSTVKIIKHEYPILYDLEKDWFNNIQKMKSLPSREATPSFSGWSINLEDYGWLIGIMAFIFIRALIAFFSAAFRQ
jgi:hypothetical protein